MKPDREPGPSRARAARTEQSQSRPDLASDDPVLPPRSPDDSDIGWGERPEPDDDERLRQDRPPHWDSA